MGEDNSRALNGAAAHRASGVFVFQMTWNHPQSVISVFDILHAVSFNYFGLRRPLACLRAGQISAQHWTFALTNFLFFLFWNWLHICLMTMLKLFKRCHYCQFVTFVFGLVVVTLLNGFSEISTDVVPAKSWFKFHLCQIWHEIKPETNRHS